VSPRPICAPTLDRLLSSTTLSHFDPSDRLRQGSILCESRVSFHGKQSALGHSRLGRAGNQARPCPLCPESRQVTASQRNDAMGHKRTPYGVPLCLRAAPRARDERWSGHRAACTIWANERVVLARLLALQNKPRITVSSPAQSNPRFQKGPLRSTALSAASWIDSSPIAQRAAW
jgi:hypothetical protein